MARGGKFFFDALDPRWSAKSIGMERTPLKHKARIPPLIRLNLGFFESFASRARSSDFRRLFRVSREVFVQVVSGIEPVWESVTSVSRGRTASTRPGPRERVCTPSEGLAIFLMFNSNYGVSYELLSLLFDISISSVCRYLSLVMRLMTERFRGEISWPTQEERSVLQNIGCIMTRGFLPGTIGFVDGTHFRIWKPKVSPDAYYNGRLHHHSFIAQVVVGTNRRILCARIGDPGLRHDSACFRDMDLYTSPRRYFSPGQYLLADSAYERTSTCQTVTKRGRGGESPLQHELKRTRVLIEHCFGIWKSCWRRLLGKVLFSDSDAVRYVHSLAIIYNLSLN